MKTFFGKAEPTALDVLTSTFGQILSSGARDIQFSSNATDHIFRADVDWIADAESLFRALSGGLIPYPSLGDNVCRIETAYRYLYEEVHYGDVDAVSVAKDGNRIMPAKWRAGCPNYMLILRNFGTFRWDEQPEVMQL
jgi:hypothetical protein